MSDWDLTHALSEANVAFVFLYRIAIMKHECFMDDVHLFTRDGTVFHTMNIGITVGLTVKP